MAFTTWSAFHQKLLDAMEANSWARQSFAHPQGGTVTFRSWDDFKKVLDYARGMASSESGTAVGRTYAKQGGRC